MRELKFRYWLLLAVALLGALWLGGVIRPAPDGLLVTSEAPTVWSAADTTEYAYIGKETEVQLGPLFADTPTYAGHAQYGSLYVVCVKGKPVAPVDGSTRELWCVAWTWDGTEWVFIERYMLGTQNRYNAWKASQQSAPAINHPE